MQTERGRPRKPERKPAPCLQRHFPVAPSRRPVLAVFYSEVDMANGNLKVVVTQAWWLKPYLICVAMLGALTRQDPDWDKVGYWIDRSMRFKIVEEGIGDA